MGYDNLHRRVNGATKSFVIGIIAITIAAAYYVSNDIAEGDSDISKSEFEILKGTFTNLTLDMARTFSIEKNRRVNFAFSYRYRYSPKKFSYTVKYVCYDHNLLPIDSGLVIKTVNEKRHHVQLSSEIQYSYDYIEGVIDLKGKHWMPDNYYIEASVGNVSTKSFFNLVP